MVPPRSTASPLVATTFLVLVGVFVAWQGRSLYLADLDQLVNEVATRYHLVPVG